MQDNNATVLVGAGQYLQRGLDPRESLDPLGLMLQACAAAAEDCGLGPEIWSRLDTLAVVDVFAWEAKNPARLLAERLEAKPRRELVSTVGGNTPQSLVNDISARIRSGDCSLALIAGANAVDTLKRARKAGIELDWVAGGDGRAEVFGDSRLGSSDVENNHSLYLPVNIYPLFENALRAERGSSLEEHSLSMASLFARFSEVAHDNPYAWFPTARSAEEIATPAPANRRVAFPYTKYMNAVMATDQSAALLLTSVARARALGIPEEKWVFFRGGADAYESPWFMSERPSFTGCPAMRQAGEQALLRSGLTVDDIDRFDLYSCFPVAVETACRELGLREDDPRGFTVTGGLPFFGGPGNNYSTHAIATVVQNLRDAGGNALVSANGWYLTKHAIGVYSSEPGESVLAASVDENRTPHSAVATGGNGTGDGSGAGRTGVATVPSGSDHAGAREGCEDHEDVVAIAVEPEGMGRIETYTVIFARDGSPKKGIVIGRLDDGRRFLALTPSEPGLLEGLCESEAVGRRGRVTPGSPANTFVPD